MIKHTCAKLKLLAIFFIVSLAHLHPILKSFFSRLPYAAHGDVRLSLAILYSNVTKLSHLRLDQIYHLPFLFPLSNTLTAGFTLFGQSILALPFFLLGRPNIYAIYNGFTFFSYVLAGFGAYLFFREFQDNEAVSIISASLYILLPFRVYNIPHLSMLFNFPIPFAFFFLLRYLKYSKRIDLLYLNIILLFQFLFELSLGFYLSVALAFFVLIYLLFERPIKFRRLVWLAFSLLPTAATVVLVHFPYLQKGVSLSPTIPFFDPSQYHPALSFYTGKSTLLLLLNGVWKPWPLFPGFVVVIFFIYSFIPYVSQRLEKVFLASVACAYLIPGLLAIVLFGRTTFAWMNTLAETFLSILLCALAALAFCLRKKAPKDHLVLAFLLLAVMFITFEPFPKWFDLFGVMAKVFPFLNRSRGLRTLYILPLPILGIFALGLKAFLEKKSGQGKLLFILVTILLLEHWRWPVTMGKLPEPSSGAKKIYALTAAYPDHFGILELPFDPPLGNMHALFSRYHDKHTYHGHYLKYNDPLALRHHPLLQADGGFSGLKDPELLEKLKSRGLNLIMIDGARLGKNRSGTGGILWRRIRENVRAGLARGLIKEVKEESQCLLAVLNDSRTGRDLTYLAPYFALIGKKSVQFRVCAGGNTESLIQFNGWPLSRRKLTAGNHLVEISLPDPAKHMQDNLFRLRSDRPITVDGWLFK